MKGRQWALLVTSFCMFAGCTESPSIETTAPASSFSDTISTTSPPVPAEVPATESQLELILDQCEWLGMLRYAVSDLVGAKPPEGWGHGPTPLTETFIELYDCQRISIGEFERGPIRLAIEVHGNREAPAGCIEGDFTSSEVITRVGVDDRELATFMAERLGLPASFATITHTEETLGQLERVAWNFSMEGFDESRLETLRAFEPELTGTYNYRRFWTNAGGGISYLDFVTTWQRGENEWPVVIGTVHEPFLRIPNVDHYTGTGYSMTNSSVRAPITEFGDMLCERPL